MLRERPELSWSGIYLYPKYHLLVWFLLCLLYIGSSTNFHSAKDLELKSRKEQE